MENNIVQGDCLKILKRIGDKKIDLLLTDPPYGITANKWDKEVDFMSEALRIADCVILTTSQPYTSKVVYKNIKHFKTDLCDNSL